MDINEEYNYENLQIAEQQINNTDKKFEGICKKISLFGCIIILLLLIYISLIIIISLNN